MTRFAVWPRWAAWLALALLVALTAYGAAVQAPRLSAPAEAKFNDEDLYAAVAGRVSHGQDYYAAAATEQRAHGYPTAPPQVFRQPVLAWVMAALQTDLRRNLVFCGLALVTGVATLLALERQGVGFRVLAAAMPVLATGLGVVIIHGMLFMHEAWAGLLIALSLALYAPRRWIVAALIGLLACCVRELAVGYLLVMLAAALWEKRWAQVAGWALTIAVFVVLFGLHLHAAAALHAPTDRVSVGWLGWGGPRFVLELARANVALLLAPTIVIGVAVGLALIGFAGVRNPIGVRAGLIVGGYMLAFLALGRADNNYWGLLYAPILPLGLVLAPPALRDIWRRAVLNA